MNENVIVRYCCHFIDTVIFDKLLLTNSLLCPFLWNRNGEEALGGKVFKTESGEPITGIWEKMLSPGLWPQTVTAEIKWAP